MFTGLVQQIGVLRRTSPRGTGRELTVACAWTDLVVGESVACNGVCLTVERGGGGAFQVVAGEETLRRTTLTNWTPGCRIHLERALHPTDRLGGHIVQGHVDGIAVVRAVDRHDGWTKIAFSGSESILRYLVAKGSVCVDGVSLTVNELAEDAFAVGIVPHTLEVTALGGLRPGEAVNVEVDVLAKYVERLLAPTREQRLQRLLEVG
jgi:riboflavin synthase